MRQTAAVAAILAVLAIPAGSADDDKPAKPKATVEQTAEVTTCYASCVAHYAERAHDVQVDLALNNNKEHRCRAVRNALASVNACESGCNAIWSLYNRPAVKLRTDLQAWLVRDSTDFGALDCHKSNTALALHNGIRIVY